MERELRGEIMAEKIGTTELVSSAEIEWNKGRKRPPPAAIVVEDDEPSPTVTDKGLFPEKFDKPLGKEVMRPILDGGEGKRNVFQRDNTKHHATEACESLQEARKTPPAASRRRRLRKRQRLAKSKQRDIETSIQQAGRGVGPPLGDSLGDSNRSSTGEQDGLSDGTTLGEECQHLVSTAEGPPKGPRTGESNFSTWPGLKPPRLSTGEEVNGANKRQYKREKKAARIEKQVNQEPVDHWLRYKGNFQLPTGLEMGKRPVDEYVGQMCPAGLALHHPAAATLLEYATQGCPCKAGRHWTISEMEEAIEKGPHVSAMDPEAMQQYQDEVKTKLEKGKVQLIAWDSIKHDPPKELKISPLAMAPHKSKKFRPILDLSFQLKLKDGGVLESVNDSTTLSAPVGAIDQMGHSLQRIIHAFATAEEGAKVFMAKWDVKDGFWRLVGRKGEEWNFAHVLPQEEGKPTMLVVPTSLQMGWVESPAFFCAASETARDVAVQYAECPLDTLPDHKFIDYAMNGEDVKGLPKERRRAEHQAAGIRYFVDVYVDDFIPICIPTCQDDLRHVTNATLHGIHDVFPADKDDSEDPISEKKAKKGDGTWALEKEALGFDFDGDSYKHTMILAEAKLGVILATLQKWIRSAKHSTKAGIPFGEFHPMICKLRHAFIALPAGKGLMTECNSIIGMQPKVVYLQRNPKLRQVLDDCRRLVRASAQNPTPCRELIVGPPGYVGIKDASIDGAGGIVVGDHKACVPTVFRLEWPQDIKEEVWKTNAGNHGNLTNSDLECAGLLLLWLVMEAVCPFVSGDHVALFSDNSPTVSWVQRMAARGSLVAGQLLRALALRMKTKHVSPLTPLHIAGKKNALTDVPSRSFGSNPAWYCKDDTHLLNLFNKMFPLPQQASWTVFQLRSDISMRVISLLRMQASTLDEWRRLPATGRHIGEIGRPTAHLWEWTLTYRESHTGSEQDCSQVLQQESGTEATVQAERSRVEQFQRKLLPLEKRSIWCAGTTLQK